MVRVAQYGATATRELVQVLVQYMEVVLSIRGLNIRYYSYLYYRIPELLRLWKFVLYLIVAKIEMTKLLLQYSSVIISLGLII